VFPSVENEHLSNSWGFRRTDFVPINFDLNNGSKVTHKTVRQMRLHMLFEAVVFIVVVVVLAIIAMFS
jgi:hypothetical protein